MSINKYSFHPISEVFPLIGDAKYADFKADISLNKQRMPIILFEDQILDGRNRYNACCDLGVEPRFENFEGTESEARDYVVSMNIHRRDLTESQAAMVAARLANLPLGTNRFTLPDTAGSTISDVAKQFNVSERSVARAKKVLTHGVTELVEQVESGKMSVSMADRIAEQPKGKQIRLIRQGRDNKIASIASRIKVESTLKKAKTTVDVCLKCNAALEANQTTFVADLEALSAALMAKPNRTGVEFARMVNGWIEDIEEFSVGDIYADIKERILTAIDMGYQTDADIRRCAKIDTEEYEFGIKMLENGNIIEPIDQGGKTENARGSRKRLWKRRERFANSRDVDDFDDDDHSLAA